MSELTRVALTPEEMLERGRELAERVRELELHDQAARDEREAMGKARKELVATIERLARVVRTGSEEREAQVGLFP